MYNKIHPYALIIGMAIGIVFFVVLKHILSALFVGFLAVLLFDLLIKAIGRNKSP